SPTARRPPSARRASTRRAASRSTRGCRTCRRPSAMASTAVEIPQLAFAVEGAQRLAHAAVPTLRFDLRVDAHGRDIRSILLDVQLQIAARRRGYEDADRERLFELFGHEKDWGTTLRTLLWARTTL